MTDRATPVPVEAEGLTRDFGTTRAVDDLSFQVGRGEIVGLLGPNGAGKTTTLRMLTGGLIPTKGQVRLHGFDLFVDGPRARAHLGYLPEQLPLYGEMTVVEYLDFVASIKGIEGTARDETLASVQALLDLEGVWKRPARVLSRGYRQRVGLAQALLGEPDLLILDEPTAGLDPNQILEFRALVRRLGRDRAVLLSTHILPEALEVCDRVMILNRGRLVAVDRPGRLARQEAGSGVVRAVVRLDRRPDPGDPRADLREEDPPGVWRIEASWGLEEANAALRRLVEQGAMVIEWRSSGGGLEEVFRRLTLGEEEP